MAGQIKFPEQQTHKKSFEMGVIGFSIFCILFTIVMIMIVEGGQF